MATDSFSIISFNVQFGQGWDHKDPDGAPVDFGRTIEALRERSADIMLLQEVEQVVPERGQVQPPPNFTRLRRAFPDYHSEFCYPPVDADELPFGYGLAILSRWPLGHVAKIPLPAPEIDFEFRGRQMRPTRRCMMGARTRVHGGPQVQLFNTHLQAFFMIDANGDDHPDQRETVLKQLQSTSLPTLLGGDLNCAPDESLLQDFESAGFSPVQSSCITWKRMPYVLDHILVSPHFEVVERGVIATDVTDHELLHARLRLREVNE